MAAAIDLADERGVAALSMARVAERTGHSTMALYRHVASKEVLLRLVADAAVGLPPARLDAPDERWRVALMRWSEDLLDALVCHPWVMALLVDGSPALPSQVAWLDRGLRALEAVELTEHDKAQVLLALNGLIFWEARLRSDAGDAEDQAAFAAHVADSDDLTALRRAQAAGALDTSTRRSFQFAITLVLDGIAVQLAHQDLRSAGSSAGGSSRRCTADDPN